MCAIWEVQQLGRTKSFPVEFPQSKEDVNVFELPGTRGVKHQTSSLPLYFEL